MFETTQVEDLLQVKKERLRWWVKDKYLTPTEIGKQGRSHQWSVEDVYRAYLFKLLMQGSITRRTAEKIVSGVNWKLVSKKRPFLIAELELNEYCCPRWPEKVTLTQTAFIDGIELTNNFLNQTNDTIYMCLEINTFVEFINMELQR